MRDMPAYEMNSENGNPEVGSERATVAAEAASKPQTCVVEGTEPREPGYALVHHAQLSLDDPSFLRPSYPREILADEEALSRQILLLEATKKTPAVRSGLAESYTGLAFLYAQAGVGEEVIRYIKKALENCSDPRLEHWLARAYGRAGDYRFITEYQRILKERKDLAFLLEFVFFLERRGYHTGALEVFEERLRSSPPTGVAEIDSLNGFLSLLQASGHIDDHTKVENYFDLIRQYVPETSAATLPIERPDITASVAIKVLTEVDEHIGLESEIKQAGISYGLALKHYLFHTLFITTNAMLVFLGLVFAPVPWVQWLGTTIYGLAIANVLMGSVSAVLGKSRPGSKPQLELLSKFLLLGPSSLILSQAGGLIFRDTYTFFHPVVFSLSMFLLVCGIFARIGIYAWGVCRQLHTHAAHLVELVRAKVYAHQVAVVVLSSSKLTLILSVLWFFFDFREQDALDRGLSLLMPLSLALMWRWGKLTVNREKRRQRDHLLAAIVVVFLLRLIGYAAQDHTALEIMEEFNFEAIMLLGITYSFVMQIIEFNLIISIVTFFIFSVMHFFPMYASALGGLMSPRQQEHFAFGMLNTDLLLCVTIMVATLHNILSNRAQRIAEEDVTMPHRKLSSFESLALLVLAIFLVAVLLILVFAAGSIGSINLWLIAVAFLIILGFAFPFFLIAFGIIDPGTWLKSFRWISGKIPVFNRPRASTVEVVPQAKNDEKNVAKP